MQINIISQALEQVRQFKYLGRKLTEDERSEREVKNRTVMAKDAFNKHRTLLTGKIDCKLKKRVSRP